MSQAEVAAVALRELNSTRTRAAMNTSYDNVGFVKRSPRLGLGATHNSQGLRSSRLARTSAGPRLSGALNDITNVAGGRPGQAYGKTGKQPPTSGQAAATHVAERPAPPVALAAASRQPTAQSAGEPHSHIPAPVAASVNVPASTADTVQGDLDNVQCVVEYADGIYDQLFRDEALLLPRGNYMDSQTDINGKMRAILIDWLIEVHMKYKLRSETLFLTVNLIDRYLSTKLVMRKKLQLVGIVAMFIAAKFEEINPPELHDFVHITDHAYTREDVLVMECNMLNTLNFLIVTPTAAHFFERLQQVNNCDEKQREVAQYLIELGLLDTRMLRYTPSHLVSAALLLSNELLNKGPQWPQHMVQHSRHSEQVLRGCAEEYRELLGAAAGSQLQAVRKKFSLPARHAVARIPFELASSTHA